MSDEEKYWNFNRIIQKAGLKKMLDCSLSAFWVSVRFFFLEQKKDDLVHLFL